MEWRGMLVILLRGVNFGFWSRLGCSGQNGIIFSHQGLVKGCKRRNNKTERILILSIYSVHINKVFHTINISLLWVCISFGHVQIGLF